MKKFFLAVFTAIIAFSFIACDKTDKTNEEMLTTKKGWVMTAATSNPAYIMDDGSGNAYTNLYKDFFEEYELDDIYTYATVENGHGLQIDPKKTGKWGYQQLVTVGVWSLFNSDTQLTTKVPGFYDKDEVTGVWIMDIVNNVDISENTLTYTYTWKTDSPVAKSMKGTRAPRITRGDPEQYTWTFTFTAK